MINNVEPILPQMETPATQFTPDVQQLMIGQILPANLQQNMTHTNNSKDNNDCVKSFKKKKKNAKIKKVIGIILLILAILAIIGAIFFLYKAFKSRHDAIEAEKNNLKHEALKKQLTSNNGKEIFFKENGKQMKYVYNEANDCFDIFEAGKNGKFNKYPVGTIAYKTTEEINKLKNVDFPKYMKIGVPALGGGLILGTVGGAMLANANRKQQDIEEQEQASQLNLLSQTPYSGNNINRQQYNTPEIQAVNNTTTTKYNITGINQTQEENSRCNQ